MPTVPGMADACPLLLALGTQPWARAHSSEYLAGRQTRTIHCCLIEARAKKRLIQQQHKITHVETGTPLLPR